MTCSKSTVKSTGLNIWFSGEQVHHEPEVDVIAVQGLGAHPYYTWVARSPRSHHASPLNLIRRRRKNSQADGLSDVAQPASETMWLRDFLPTVIPNARIATYSYESDWRREEFKASLRRSGQQLLDVLHQNRSSKKECRRPLVFIGHSLGGLIIKQALVIAAHGDDFTNIQLSTAGIIFLGTPHPDSDAAMFDPWFAQAVNHDKKLLKYSKSKVAELHEITRDFETSYRAIDMTYFHENKIGSYGPWRTQLVDRQSTTLDGRKTIFLNTDHSGLNKFDALEDENFCLVLPEIKRMVQNAPSMIELRYRLHPAINEKDFRIGFSLQGMPIIDRFVARDPEMKLLKQELLPNLDVRRKVVVLLGLGGIGKTQLAIEFARKYQKSYSAVLWINGSTKEELRQSIANLASRLPQDQVSEITKSYWREEKSNVDEVVNEVLNWLSQPLNNQWLLIFDNLSLDTSEDPEESGMKRYSSKTFNIESYFPKADHGSILVTSRLVNLSRLGTVMKLEPCDELQAENILMHILGKSIEGSSKLVRLLQGLPLAINQAGWYMRETGTSAEQYMELYDRAWRNLMTLREDIVDRRVWTTWTLSFDHLRAQSEEAANLLLLCGFLDNQDLWYGLFAPALNQKIIKIPDWFAKCVGNELDFKECIALLLSHSFIDVNTESSSSFSMHPVFHRLCLHAFEEKNAAMSKLAMIIVASAIPSKTVPHYPLIQRRLLPHCGRVFSLAQQRVQETLVDEMYLQWQNDAYHELGALFWDQGRIKEAEGLYLQALAGKGRTRGAEHASTLDTVNNLANLYRHQGKMEEAEEMYRRALTGYEKAWGAEHTLTLNTVNNLANLYSDQGKTKEAEEMYLRALTGYEKAWGAEHTSTLNTVSSLANLYSNQGKMEKAENMYMRALAGYEKAWGAEHTSTLDIVNNLANLYRHQGKMEEAEEMYRRVLTRYEKAWGAEHTLTLNTVNNLANLYSDQGKTKEAEEMYLRALTGYEKAWGPDYPSTLHTVNNLAILYEHQGKMEKAEDMYLRALSGKEKAWGAEHTSTLNTVCNLANLYSNQGDMMEAEHMYMRALRGYEKAFGAEHPSTLDTVNNLGALYSDQGKMKEAEDMYLRAFSGKEKTWGAEHTSTLVTVNNLGVLYSDRGKLKDAEEMYVRALTGYENSLGAEHPSTLDIVNNLANLYWHQGKTKEAEDMYRQALAGYEKACGAEHPSTLHTVNSLGHFYNDQGKLANAELMYHRALASGERIFGPEHSYTLDAINNLASIYSDQGNVIKAETMFQQAMDGYEKVLGFDHPRTIDTVNKLGNLYIQVSRLESAEVFLRRAVIGYTRSLGIKHPSTEGASRNLAYVQTLRGTGDQNLVTISDSDASSIDSYHKDGLLAPSSVSSVSAFLPQIMMEEFITRLAQLFRKDESIRATIWKALKISRDELKFDRPKIVRNFSRLLRRYAGELNQISSASEEKLTAKFLRQNSHSIAHAVFQTVQPTEILQDRTGNFANQPVEKLMLDRFLEDAQAQDVIEIKTAESGPQNRQAMRHRKGDGENTSSDESEASHIDEFQIDYPIERVEVFMISSVPFANLKQRFQDFVERWTLNDMPEVDAVRNPKHRDVSSHLTYTEDGRVQIRWQCKCGHQFQETMVEHKPGVAEEFVRRMHWDAPPDKQGLPYQLPSLHEISRFLRTFLPQDGLVARLREDLWRQILRLLSLYPPHGAQRHPSIIYGDNVTATNAGLERLSYFVCICIRQMSRSKYLHHVEVNRNSPRMDDQGSTDSDFFRAIQRQYQSVRPWWKRLLFCARLSSVEYYEFRLFDNPEDKVIIEENWKDRFPKDHPEGEWHYIPTERDHTPYLFDDQLFHLVQSPDHAKLDKYFWERIPKKVREKLSCQNDPNRPGWGLVMKEEWHQTAFLICWVPVIVIGAAGSGLYCFHAEKPASIGFTVFGGIFALIVWFYQLAQGYAKQGGLL